MPAVIKHRNCAVWTICAKTAELIEMPFELLTSVGPKAAGARGPAPTRKIAPPSWAVLWPGIFLTYRSLCAL